MNNDQLKNKIMGIISTVLLSKVMIFLQRHTSSAKTSNGDKQKERE